MIGIIRVIIPCAAMKEKDKHKGIKEEKKEHKEEKLRKLEM